MMPQSPVHRAFALLSIHARIHDRLDTFSRRQRELLEQIERREILAYDDNPTFGRLEALKRELVKIAFVKEGPIGPLP